MCDEDPCDGAGDRRFEVLGQTTAAAKPGRRSFNDPSTRQDLKAFGDVRTPDDFQRPCAFPFQRGAQFGAGATAVREDMS